MGKADLSIKRWLGNKTRFANLFNGVYFDGKQVILPEQLEEINGESDIIIEDTNDKKKGIQRFRDMVYRWKNQMDLAILVCESQDKMHYAMPVREMLYDALSYTEQINQLHHQHKLREKEENIKEKLTEEEFLSHFRKSDRLVPVVSIIYYYGLEEWNVNKDLYDMFGIIENSEMRDILKRAVPNYFINVFNPTQETRFDQFSKDLQLIFGMLQYREDKNELRNYILKNEAFYKYLDKDTYNAIVAMLHSEKELKQIQTKSKEGVDMCKALQDIKEEGREEGLMEGELLQICKFYTKGKVSLEEAIEEANLSEEEFFAVMKRFGLE